MLLGWQEIMRRRIGAASRRDIVWARSVCLAVLMLGVVVGPAAGQETIVLPHQDWNVVCPPDVLCFANYETSGLQLVVGYAKRSGALSVNLFIDRQAAPDSPISIWTSAGLTLELSVTSCNEQYCHAIIAQDKTGTVIAAFNNAESGMVAYVVDNRIVIVPVSFHGSTSAISAIGG